MIYRLVKKTVQNTLKKVSDATIADWISIIGIFSAALGILVGGFFGAANWVDSRIQARIAPYQDLMEARILILSEDWEDALVLLNSSSDKFEEQNLDTPLTLYENVIFSAANALNPTDHQLIYEKSRREILKKSGLYAWHYLQFGIFELYTSNYSAAEINLSRAIGEYGKEDRLTSQGEAFWMRGTLHACKGEEDLAYADWDEAARLNPKEFSPSVLKITLSQFEQDRFTKQLARACGAKFVKLLDRFKSRIANAPS